jgi:hypothetical protein
MGMEQGEVLFYPMLPNFLKGISLFEGSQASPAFHFERTRVKAINWNNNWQMKTKALGLKLAFVPICPSKISSELACN